MTGFLSCAAWAPCEHPTRTRCAIFFRVSGSTCEDDPVVWAFATLSNTTAPRDAAPIPSTKEAEWDIIFSNKGVRVWDR